MKSLKEKSIFENVKFWKPIGQSPESRGFYQTQKKHTGLYFLIFILFVALWQEVSIDTKLVQI